MKKTIKVEKEVDLKTLHIEAGVRYWENTTVDGVEDTKGDLIPCRDGDLWKPVIDLETGRVINWEHGKKAEVHYKVCDAGSYFIKDADGNTVMSKEDDYVPDMMCPADVPDGDYIIMSIDENGMISNWKFDLSDWEDD